MKQNNGVLNKIGQIKKVDRMYSTQCICVYHVP